MPEPVIPVITASPATSDVDDLNDWFDDMVRTIGVERLQYNSGTLPKDKEDSYRAFAKGEFDRSWGNKTSRIVHKEFIAELLWDYLNSINEFIPKKLAFDLRNSKVMVWAEIETENEDLEDRFYLTEAKLNSEFEKFGYCIDTIVVREDDSLKIPAHYVALIP